MNLRLTTAVLALFLLGLLGCRADASEASKRPPRVVRVATVKSGVEAPIKRRGTVQADSRLRLGFKLPGILAAVLVKEGDRVHKGQLLARLDQTDALGQARVAGAGRNKASRDWKKAQQLVKEGAVAEGLRDDARSGLEAADANLALALDNLKRTRLKSPVNGTVAQRLAEPGESVGAGVPVLLIDETDKPVVRVGIAERDLSKVQVGQLVSLQPEDGSAAFAGKVSSVASSPNAADGLYAVEIDPEQRALLPGSLIVVQFDQPKATPVLRVPLGAVVRREDRDHVFVVEGQRDADVVHMRPIEVGRSEGRDVTVRSGLKDGERVVTEGAYFMQDGQTVRTLN